MLAKFKLGIPLLMVLALAMTMLALPTKSATATSTGEKKCYTRRWVDIEFSFPVVLTSRPIPPTTKTFVDAFGDAFPTGFFFVNLDHNAGFVDTQLTITPGSPRTVQGYLELTATNGDDIFVQVKGTLGDADANGNSILDIEGDIFGGTGRFQWADGFLDFWNNLVGPVGTPGDAPGTRGAKLASSLNLTTGKGVIEGNGKILVRQECRCRGE
jgi:hypothetical protein